MSLTGSYAAESGPWRRIPNAAPRTLDRDDAARERTGPDDPASDHPGPAGTDSSRGGPYGAWANRPSCAGVAPEAAGSCDRGANG
ncbi:MAG TPA: hypothetical protein VF667_10355, partial [Pseudonocardia sp.]